MNLTTSTILKGAALAVSLISALNIPGAFASNYNLRGAICSNGGNPSVAVVNKDGKFAIDLSTGGKNKVGLVIQGLQNNPITVKDLDVKSPITAVFGSIDKGVLKYGGLWCKISIRNDVGDLVVPTCKVSASQFDIDRGGTVPLLRVGDAYSATVPSSIITNLGKEVPRLKLSENSKVIGYVIYLDGDTVFDTDKTASVSSVSVAGEQLSVKLENPLGCDAFPTVVIVQ